MEVINKWSAEHRRQVSSYREKWKAAALATVPVDRDRVEMAVKALYQEIELDPPEEFLFYTSPAAAWRDFPAWFPRTGRCLVAFWPYQLPLFNPRSFWRKWGEDREVIDLAVRRKAGKGQAWVRNLPRDDAPGNILDPVINREIWAAFDNLVERDWAWGVVREIAVRFPEGHDRLRDMADAEDPSSPIDVAEFVYLGPFLWLLQELACVDFCQAVLGCRTNAALYGSLNDLVCNGSILMTFEHLGIICERPAGLLEGPALARYGDGYTAAW